MNPPMPPKRAAKAITPHVTGVLIEHRTVSDTKTQTTTIKAELVDDKIRLYLKQGASELKIWGKDWAFFKDQIEQTLAKKRLITSK